MKYLIIILSIFALFLGVQPQANAQTNNDKDQFSVKVDGLGCPFCAYGLEKKFKELKGIKKVAIEMETGMMTFEYPTDKSLSIERVAQQVEAAGYTPVSVEVARTDGTIESSQSEVIEEHIEESALVEARFFVAGNCGMCKARIEKAANGVAGVTVAEWDKESKELFVTFDSSLVQQEEIEAAIAKSGHDTTTSKAEEETYKNLPGCCQYERVP